MEGSGALESPPARLPACQGVAAAAADASLGPGRLARARWPPRWKLLFGREGKGGRGAHPEVALAGCAEASPGRNGSVHKGLLCSWVQGAPVIYFSN